MNNEEYKQKAREADIDHLIEGYACAVVQNNDDVEEIAIAEIKRRLKLAEKWIQSAWEGNCGCLYGDPADVIKLLK